jgi:hypothetical protein
VLAAFAVAVTGATCARSLEARRTCPRARSALGGWQVTCRAAKHKRKGPLSPSWALHRAEECCATAAGKPRRGGSPDLPAWRATD